MSRSTAECLLVAIGRDVQPRGVITVDQMPGAIDALKELVGPQANGANGRTKALAEHTFPLIEILEQAGRAGKAITWGI